jgi:hypothetical protein
MTMYSYALRLMSDAASNGTGTITVSNNDTAVVGSTTAFTTELVVGDVVIFDGVTYAVDAITDNTHLTISRPAEAAESGLAFTYYNLTNVEALTGAARFMPRSSFRPYTEAVQLANGKLRGLGRPIATWRWGFITQTVRDSLRAFCNNMKSNAVYVRTKTNENADSYQTFTGTIVWPDDEDRQTGRRINFELILKNLVEL